jgi:hypothetical protein
MAGPYAHILACDSARKLASLDGNLGKLLSSHQCMLFLGAVSPDLPAIWDNAPMVGGERWSDRFHTIHNTDAKRVATNHVVEKAFMEIRAIPDEQTRLDGLAWLLGYVGHMVTDVVVHPVVRECITQAKDVGISDGGALHQRIEIVMDTMLVKALLGKEGVAGSPLLAWLHNAGHDQHRKQVMAVWAKAIEDVYGESADPAHWYDSYVGALSGLGDSPFQFRGFTYPKFADIPEFERAMYYQKLMLPNDTIGPYKTIFDLATAKVGERWGTIWQRWTCGASLAGVIPDWDLNTGANYTASIALDLWPEASMLGIALGGRLPYPRAESDSPLALSVGDRFHEQFLELEHSRKEKVVRQSIELEHWRQDEVVRRTEHNLPIGVETDVSPGLRHLPRAGRRQPGSPDAPTQVPGAEPVDAAVFCPPTVARSARFLLQVLLYPPARADEAVSRAQEADDTAERRGVLSFPLDLPRGTWVDLHLDMPGLQVDEPDAVLVWRGFVEGMQFEVAVPKGAPLGKTIGRLLLCIAGVPVSKLRFQVNIVEVAAAEVSRATKVEASRYRRAFVSYSSEDRAEVLKRVQGSRIAGLEIFQDALDLDPGERWERRLYEEIRRCDVFLLFWSHAASASIWVGKEIEYALSLKEGHDDRPPDIQPVPIEGPPIPKPPENLCHLHFNDALLAHIAAAERS